MQYASLLALGLLSLGSIVTADGNKDRCSLTTTMSDQNAEVKCPRLPPRVNECAFRMLSGPDATHAFGPCPGPMHPAGYTPMLKRSPPEPTANVAMHKHTSVTMTIYADGGVEEVACRNDEDDLGDCEFLDGYLGTPPPPPTPKTVLRTSTVNQDLAKRSFTTTKGPCTAVCKDNLFNDCDVHCSLEHAAQGAGHKNRSYIETLFGLTFTLDCKPRSDGGARCTSPTAAPKPVLQQRGIVTVTNDGCTVVCCSDKADPACEIHCEGGFAAQVALPTPKPTTKPVLHQRGLTTTHDGCTAVCWDQYPGTGCDILCHDTSITKMPEPTSGVSSLWTTSFSSFGCNFTCQDLYPGSECGVQCPGPLPTRAFAPARAALAAPSNAARRSFQARQAQEARLARKFGLDTRDEQQKAVSEAASALSEASVALAAATTSTVLLPSAASAALSQAASFLSSVSQIFSPTIVSATLTGTARVTLSSAGTASILFPASSGNSTVPSRTLKGQTPSSPNPSSTSTLTSIVTLIASATTLDPHMVNNEGDTSAPTDTSIAFTGGASYEGQSLAGLLVLIMIGVIGSVAFMI